MALSGLEIYKLLPKVNCRECGFPTCLAFAMQLAAKKTTLAACPKLNVDSRLTLESAAQPPIQLVTVGSGAEARAIGNETVLFRHEETFRHGTLIGFILDDTLSEVEFTARVAAIDALTFQRVGQTFSADLIALQNRSGDEALFTAKARILDRCSRSPIVLRGENLRALEGALAILASRRPLIGTATPGEHAGIAGLAVRFKVPLAAAAPTLEDLAVLTQNLKTLGVAEMVLDVSRPQIQRAMTDLTNIRRLALKK
ncbi:MAG: (Fe-S)-binding protein, partial [Candidatus Omnitrophota bacterium]